MDDLEVPPFQETLHIITWRRILQDAWPRKNLAVERWGIPPNKTTKQHGGVKWIIAKTWIK